MSNAAATTHDTNGIVAKENYNNRSLLVYVPARLPKAGTRALVIVLHGGMGNAERIESHKSEHGLNMDSVADQDGFIVAYLNGTRATRFLGGDKLAWNAGGGCCGQAAANNVDDVGYIQGAAEYLIRKYGIDPNRIYGIGHSNGAMMTQRMMCETNLYAAAIAISGPLNLDVETCPKAHGKKLLALHGANDENVPLAGGRGTKGISNAVYKSEELSQKIYAKSGATYDLQIVVGADHKLDNIEDQIKNKEGLSIAEKAAHYFGLMTAAPSRPSAQ